MNIQKTVAKKAYQEIRNIKNANNMVSVEGQINIALLKAFGLDNLGGIKLFFLSGKAVTVNFRTYKSKLSNFELLNAIRKHNLSAYGEDAKKYLISFIPERLHKSEMYQRLVN